MSLRAYIVEKKIEDELFDCYYPDEWFERLQRLDKFENGVWMEFTERELDEMEADQEYPLSDEEKEIVANIRAAIAARMKDYVCLEYC